MSSLRPICLHVAYPWLVRTRSSLFQSPYQACRRPLILNMCMRLLPPSLRPSATMSCSFTSPCPSLRPAPHQPTALSTCTSTLLPILPLRHARPASWRTHASMRGTQRMTPRSRPGWPSWPTSMCATRSGWCTGTKAA